MVENRSVETSSDEIDLKDIFRTLFRYKLMIVGVTLFFLFLLPIMLIFNTISTKRLLQLR